MNRAKQHAIDQGGKIEHEYTLIKGFSYVVFFIYTGCPQLTPPSVKFDKDSVQTLESNEHIKAVEADGKVSTM